MVNISCHSNFIWVSDINLLNEPLWTALGANYTFELFLCYSAYTIVKRNRDMDEPNCKEPRFNNSKVRSHFVNGNHFQIEKPIRT